MKSLHLSNVYHLLAIAWLLLFALINSGECGTTELIDTNFVEAAFALSEGEILPVQVPILSLPENGTVIQSTATALLQAWQPWTSPLPASWSMTTLSRFLPRSETPSTSEAPSRDQTVKVSLSQSHPMVPSLV